MDRVRLGRVLGRGTRLAARTAYQALDAATSTSPATQAANSAAPPTATNQPSTARPHPSPRIPSPATLLDSVYPKHLRNLRPVAHTVVHAAQQSRILAPLKRASRAVSLQVTGSFFALFAFSFALATWHAVGELHTAPYGPLRIGIFAAIALFFGYSAIANFLRAHRLR